MTSGSDPGPLPERQRPTDSDRAAFRAYVRAHHPDVGGDPKAFATGLDRWRARHHTGPQRCAVDRFGGPVVFVVHPTGIRGLVHEFRKRRARRHRGPRVR